ncbi:phage tail sheath subtilisin-like domain-containing protein [Acidovorax sp. GBBC 3332]|nr:MULTISPECIES: phage tail sheath subtilisin-like domain-containing protein [unclassified Acidovorax]MDA8449837.1 phage tail sheath subtilisin-like domain-containing protein [Acidovorax sp. GBBC 3297]MDA8459282.1 phage tail sheath subtilisin-like domain-containing protein [Acidovorax sp. GBBC 3333]MDA8464319.1 phage tail sheath subtilisin-like domain-containing protein [Acidovorax sp. GBBC 3332]MDA8469471.1 phage tail sheath subtilisin-like domain-containing protein [Acidovorax sp. GBBC 3299]
MAANFLHGAETIEIEKGPRPIRVVKSAVIGLVGTAPAGSVHTPTLVLSDKQAAQFGAQVPGFSIPQALDGIFDQGAGTVIVINVLDPAVHKTAVAGEAVVLQGDAGKTAKPAWVGAATVKNQAGAVTHVAGVDYTADPTTGSITRLAGGAIAPGATLTVAYTYADPTKVTPADVIGAVNAAGRRTGMQALLDTYNLLGFFAKILIAPGYCTLNAVSTEMIALAGKLRAVPLIDAPVGTTFAQALAGRGPSGSINFATSSDRAVLCYPHLQVYDAATDGTRLEPMSPRLAGVIAAKDSERGYWWSPSNTEIKGVVGVETPLTAMINDPQSEVNQLNEAGIVTVFSSYGTGLRVWGNRSAAWPSVTHPRNFISVRRTADVLHESLEYSMLQFIDMPINNALIDAIKESVNAFIRTLIARGALVDGRCLFDPAKNPVTEIALGHLTFDIEFMPPTPNERMTFESSLNIELLKQLAAA